MYILEENKRFQNELEDVTKGINRIRYLKQKINNSLSNVRIMGKINDQQEVGSKEYQSFRINQKKLDRVQFNIKKRNILTVESQRKKQNQFSFQKPTLFVNQNYQFKNSKSQKKWDDSFACFSTRNNIQEYPKLIDHNKMQTFYHFNLTKKINKCKIEVSSLFQLKNQNYLQMKKEKEKLKIKIQQEKQNYKQEVIRMKQRVLFHKQATRKKKEIFNLEKLEDIKRKKQEQVVEKKRKIHELIRMQVKLEKNETQRLKQFEESIVLKENMKRVLEEKVKRQKLKQMKNDYKETSSTFLNFQDQMQNQ